MADVEKLFEQAAVDTRTSFERRTLASIAVSLKRIADAMTASKIPANVARQYVDSSQMARNLPGFFKTNE